jgi:hypothetical protein
VRFQPALLHHYGLRSADLIELPFDEREALMVDLIHRERREAMRIRREGMEVT